MNDLISRQAAIDAVRTYLSDCCVEDGDYHASGIEYELNDLPSAQPVIIHCKECKWYNGESNQCNAQICASMRGEDFCSKGERREG